jgi:hypothetical protein
MPSSCVIRKGFLTLRDCGNPASRNCSACGRPACSKHLDSASGFTQCVECASSAARDRDPGVYDYGTDWPYRYRHHYYSRGYRPIYTGSYYYNDYDVRSFDSRTNASTVDHDNNPASTFGDS